MRNRSLLGLLGVVLVGCPPLAHSTTETFEMPAEALVVEGAADSSHSLTGYTIVVAEAQAGEYFIFVADTEPTSFAALAAFDPDLDCAATIGDAGASVATNGCVVAGIGRYAGRNMNTGPGRLEIKAAATARYLVLARRGTSAFQPISVDVTVSSEGGDACGSSDPPTLERVYPAAN